MLSSPCGHPQVEGMNACWRNEWLQSSFPSPSVEAENTQPVPSLPWASQRAGEGGTSADSTPPLGLHWKANHCACGYARCPTSPNSLHLFWFVFLPHLVTLKILVPWPGIEPMLPAMEAWSFNHWTTREVLHLVLTTKSPVLSPHSQANWDVWSLDNNSLLSEPHFSLILIWEDWVSCLHITSKNLEWAGKRGESKKKQRLELEFSERSFIFSKEYGWALPPWPWF